MSVFVNFTNHPSQLWGEKQRQEANRYGEIIDLPFPDVDPYADEAAINRLCALCVEKIMALQPAVVLCQGEFSLSYAVIRQLKQLDMEVVAACSQRNVVYSGKVKETRFEFIQFRKYED